MALAWIREMLQKNRTMTARHSAAVVFVISLLVMFGITISNRGFTYLEASLVSVLAALMLACAAYARAKMFVK